MLPALRYNPGETLNHVRCHECNETLKIAVANRNGIVLCRDCRVAFRFMPRGVNRLNSPVANAIHTSLTIDHVANKREKLCRMLQSQ